MNTQIHIHTQTHRHTHRHTHTHTDTHTDIHIQRAHPNQAPCPEKKIRAPCGAQRTSRVRPQWKSWHELSLRSYQHEQGAWGRAASKAIRAGVL
jgi:hypothetical protein